jgi:DNA-directed RNA polymerase specialized sigma subunit
MVEKNKMTREMLSQYVDLKQEINLLENKIKEMESREVQCVSDVVRGSSKQFPYIEHNVRVSGVDMEFERRMKRAIGRKKVQLKELKLRLEEDEVYIYDYIQNQKDSRTRQVLVYSYIDGLKQNQVADIMHIDRSLVSKIISFCIK